MEPKQLLVTAFIFVLIQLKWCNGCWEDERVGLLQLQSSFNITWFSLEKTDNCCDWSGIECDARTGRVTHLDLSHVRDWDSGDWYLNASLFLPFKQLTSLYLSSNLITDCLRNEGFERVAELNNLKYLDLSDNNFNNNVLQSLSGLLFLESLDISHNTLKGSINLKELASLKNLEVLRLSENDISGFGQLANFNKLKSLDLSYNNFNNNILPSLNGLSLLKSLDISYSNLKGSINLEELASLKNLEVLWLSGNKNISEFVATKDARALPKLNTIYLNDMTNDGMSLLLKSLTSFSCLKTLFLKYNNLTKSAFNHDSQTFKCQENLYLHASVVDDNFFRSLHMLSSLKSLLFPDGYGLNNLQALCNLNLNNLRSLVLSYNKLISGFSPCLSNFMSLQHLDLSGNNLNGELPPSLSNFTSLQYLDLSHNSLVGNLSSSPLNLITSIQYLNLQGNNFHIPISFLPFYNCSNLSLLNIEGNELYVETEQHNFIPKFQLEELDISCNGCGGSFPRFLYSQHNLQRVDLSGNKIRGEFPHWLLENNTRLQYLYLSNNSLTGTIRLPTHSHVNLSTLVISSNYFSGQIPKKLGSYFPSLEYLDMSHNELNGSFPLSIGNLSSLRYLDLSKNNLSGELPKFLNCLSLRLFDISENDISGSLPMFSRSYLSEVYLAKNNLNGFLPWPFSNSSDLRILVLNHNSLTGIIPNWIGNLSVLNFLQLAHNFLEGEIPIELCMLDELRFLDLSNNNLSGQISPCLKSSHIADQDFVRNDPSKSIEFTTKSLSYSYEGITLALLSGIDLSCNKVIGKIPHELGNLTKIRALNLSHNSLRGSIPSTFSNLEEIECLDLSHNSLEGKIPFQLTQLKAISSFSVAYNNLSGRTPDFVNQFATFENTSYVGNPFLCGKPLSKSCEATIPPSTLSEPSTKNEDGDGFIDMEVFYVSFGVSYVMVLMGIVAVLYVNPYWRRAWLYFIERNMNNCYYFILDLFNF